MSMTFLERSQKRGTVVPLTSEQVIASLRVRLMRCQELLVDLCRHLNEPGNRVRLTQYTEAWRAIEAMLRTIFGFEGCVIGPDGCAMNVPVRCEFCSRVPMEVRNG